MKRFSVILAGALLVGCSSDNKPAEVCTRCEHVTTTQPTSKATETPAAAPAPAVASPSPAARTTPSPTVIAPAVPAVAPLAPTEWIEDGKTYLFASPDALIAYRNGQQQPVTITRNDLSPSGKTVVIEAATQAQADQLIAGFAKSHPIANK